MVLNNIVFALHILSFMCEMSTNNAVQRQPDTPSQCPGDVRHVYVA